MTTITTPLTDRIPIEASVVEQLLCALGLHRRGRWEIRTGTLTIHNGRRKTSREVFVQVQECIPCGKARTKKL